MTKKIFAATVCARLGGELEIMKSSKDTNCFSNDGNAHVDLRRDRAVHGTREFPANKGVQRDGEGKAERALDEAGT